MAIVRTQAGSDRFEKPIGSPLDDQPEAEAVAQEAPVSSLRLRSLRAMIMDKLRVGDEGAAAALSEKFRAEYARFSRGMTPGEASQALNSDA